MVLVWLYHLKIYCNASIYLKNVLDGNIFIILNSKSNEHLTATKTKLRLPLKFENSPSSELGINKTWLNSLK